ncbi:hypothetical protein MHBO_000779 [Bonamia ostreae]|uniref:Uncharacterized protein n=1 Tax=Bonamia ostreae TaxID=126728 RepID=A0ABV2AHF5_9EUKA
MSDIERKIKTVTSKLRFIKRAKLLAREKFPSSEDIPDLKVVLGPIIGFVSDNTARILMEFNNKMPLF